MSAIGKTQIAATGVLFGKRSLATPQGRDYRTRTLREMRR